MAPGGRAVAGVRDVGGNNRTVVKAFLAAFCATGTLFFGGVEAGASGGLGAVWKTAVKSAETLRDPLTQTGVVTTSQTGH